MDFSRLDGPAAAKKEAKRVASLQGQDAMNAYGESCAFTLAQVELLNSLRAPASFDELGDFCVRGVAPPPLLLIRLMGWWDPTALSQKVRNWEDYQTFCRATPGLGAQLADLAAQHAKKEKDRKAMATTGLTAPQARHLALWRAGLRAHAENERAVLALGIAFNRHCREAAEKAAEVRRSSSNPWAAYIALEERPPHLWLSPSEQLSFLQMRSDAGEGKAMGEWGALMANNKEKGLLELARSLAPAAVRQPVPSVPVLQLSATALAQLQASPPQLPGEYRASVPRLAPLLLKPFTFDPAAPDDAVPVSLSSLSLSTSTSTSKRPRLTSPLTQTGPFSSSSMEVEVPTSPLLPTPVPAPPPSIDEKQQQ